ncbi:MAG: SO_0444 family Cu/Zn efflux transporter [Magnetococcales bacterium]|nr:SO_0444 family Cu/Zn efflux transporter [Magnetococcales bacterium]
MGLLGAGVVKGWTSEGQVMRWLGGQGFQPVVRAALAGAPLPLCSCGVVPLAMSLNRNGASKGATIAFLIATPETGIDSIALSWAMLGPWLTVFRPLSAIVSAIVTGILVLWIHDRKPAGSAILEVSQPRSIPIVTASCCSSRCDTTTPNPEASDWLQRLRHGWRYATHDLWDDMVLWLWLGLLATALIMTWVEPDSLRTSGRSDWLGMLLVIAASLPIYVCASASTPLAASMLYSGLSPGLALAFMIAGPATNLTTLVIVKREFGIRVFFTYFFGIVVSAMAAGLTLDQVILAWEPPSQPSWTSAPDSWLPPWLSWGSLAVLAVLTLAAAKRRLHPGDQRCQGRQ